MTELEKHQEAIKWFDLFKTVVDKEFMYAINMESLRLGILNSCDRFIKVSEKAIEEISNG